MLRLRHMKVFIVLACVAFGCLSPDLQLAAEEQATWNGDGEDPDGEVIEVEGELDPNWEGPDQGAPGNTNPGEPSGGAGGGGDGGAEESGGGPKPKPRPIPERKDCTGLIGAECVGCCEYNYHFVDGRGLPAKARGSQEMVVLDL